MGQHKPLYAEVMKDHGKFTARVEKMTSEDITPIAKLSKIQLPIVQANKQLIVYHTTKPGVIRAISQEDGIHATIDASSHIDNVTRLQLVEIGEEESMILVANNQRILVWFVDYTRLEETASVDPLAVTLEPESELTGMVGIPGKRHLIVCWKTGDDVRYCGNCNVFSGNITPAMKLETGVGEAVTHLEEYTDMAVVTDGLGIEMKRGDKALTPNNLNYDPFTGMYDRAGLSQACSWLLAIEL
jgi:hypothetical protein